MKIRDRVRGYLGIFDLYDRLDQQTQSNRRAIEVLRDEQMRLRVLIVEKFDQNKPASVEAFDAIMRETRDRLDIVMVCLDSFNQTIKTARR
jgi:hypothetical protein